jgi:hypothetical protein
VFCVISERQPDLCNRGVESVVEVDERVLRPNLRLKLFTCDQATRIFQQDCQDLKWLNLQRKFYAILAQLSCL